MKMEAHPPCWRRPLRQIDPIACAHDVDTHRMLGHHARLAAKVSIEVANAPTQGWPDQLARRVAPRPDHEPRLPSRLPEPEVVGDLAEEEDVVPTGEEERGRRDRRDPIAEVHRVP